MRQVELVRPAFMAGAGSRRSSPTGRHAVRDGAAMRLVAAMSAPSARDPAPRPAEGEREYFLRRSREARRAAFDAAGRAARGAHEEMAARYAILALAAQRHGSEERKQVASSAAVRRHGLRGRDLGDVRDESRGKQEMRASGEIANRARMAHPAAT